MKQQDYYVHNQKQRRNIEKTKRNATPRDRKTMQPTQMNSIPNSKPFASWDPLLQMSCDPLSTRMTQRTSHFWWNNEGCEMMESDNGKVMTNKSCQILQFIKNEQHFT
jgi:hypothetical protein